MNLVEFDVRVFDIANKSFALGERIFECKLVRKVLRSLPRRFDMKVATIEEDKKGNEVAFQSIKDEKLPKKDKTSPENLIDSIAMLTKQFSKVDKIFKNRPNNYGNNGEYQNNFYKRRRDTDKDTIKIDRSFRCRECEGSGHYQAECPNFLKKQKKNSYSNSFRY